MRTLCSTSHPNISLGENIDSTHLYRQHRLLICGISNNAGENETRKNPGQTFENISSENAFTMNHYCGYSHKVYETYCRLIKADSIQLDHINFTFSISHASTIVC